MSSVISFVLGTRPEIIKLSPVIRACDEHGVSYSLIHTGQHYSRELDDIFFEQLNLRVPDYDLEVGSASHGRQTGEMIAEIETVLEEESPEVVLVQGDTNSVLAGTVAASKLPDVKVGHVEAGLRSYDREMPEEINRRLADHASDYCFAPTEETRENLLSEDIPSDRIVVTGNTIVDAVKQNVRIARERSTVRKDLSLDGPFALLTAHRAENVDDRDRFISLLNGVAAAARERDLSVVYPIHPRAEKRVEEFDIDVPDQIGLVDPQDFLDFLVLEDDATIVFTDSGGVQEETSILQTPCVTLRDSTERPETITVGSNVVVGVEPDDVVEGAQTILSRSTDWKKPFGDGTAAKLILDELGYHDRS